jgi:hypothetical protein
MVKWILEKSGVVVHTDGMSLCLWTAATSGPIVHPPDDEYGEPWWNDTDRGKTKNSEKYLSIPVPLSTTIPTWTNPGLRRERPATKP